MPCYKICQSVVQVKKFAPHLHHTIKSFAIIRNFIDKYNILIIFAICLQIVKYQRIYKRLKSATFKYCPGHTEIKSQLIDNRLRFFICHCAATASPSPMGRQANIRMRPQQAHSTNLSRGGACGRPRPFSNPCIRAAAPCSAVVRPIRERSASRKTSCHSNPEYFDAKSIKPEKFRRTGKFRVGKNRGKGIFQPPEGPENLYNIRNCSYTKYLLSNI